MPSPVPARLHVLLASESPAAVVIRRGPSRHTAVIGWDRKADTFRMGQWLYGRIYERRCDLSPDGRHRIYFAMNGRWDSAVKGSWTAIARAPYLKAIALYAKGGRWNGGGLFLSRREYWLNDGSGHERQRDDSGLVRSTGYPWHERYGGECPGVYYVRLQRGGWSMKHTAADDAGGQIVVFEKPASAHWQIRKKAHATVRHPVGRGCYFDEHELCNARTGEVIDCHAGEWADVDDGRMVWAADGKLFAARLGPKGLGEVTELQDFSPFRFAKLEAPY